MPLHDRRFVTLSVTGKQEPHRERDDAAGSPRDEQRSDIGVSRNGSVVQRRPAPAIPGVQLRAVAEQQLCNAAGPCFSRDVERREAILRAKGANQIVQRFKSTEFSGRCSRLSFCSHRAGCHQKWSSVGRYH